MTFFIKALEILNPGASWTVLGEDNYENLKWISEDIPKPTREEVEAKIEELKALEPMRLLRIHRDKLLAETDWITIKAYNQGVPVSIEWSTYCQALRDLPKTAIPILDSTNPLGISGVEWPVKPQ